MKEELSGQGCVDWGGIIDLALFLVLFLADRCLI